jgi:hypothetical protein
VVRRDPRLRPVSLQGESRNLRRIAAADFDDPARLEVPDQLVEELRVARDERRVPEAEGGHVGRIRVPQQFHRHQFVGAIQRPQQFELARGTQVQARQAPRPAEGLLQRRGVEQRLVVVVADRKHADPPELPRHRGQARRPDPSIQKQQVRRGNHDDGKNEVERPLQEPERLLDESLQGRGSARFCLRPFCAG